MDGRSVHSVPQDRPWWLAVLLRGPSVYRSVLVRAIITLVIVAGVVCVLGSGVIHLYLWGKQYGYRDIPTIGPLFLIQGIAAILIGLIVIISRQVGVLLVASVIALVLAIEVGLFGFKDSWLAPYAWTTFYEEIAGGVLLLAAAGVLCYSGKGYSGKAGR